MNEQTVFSALLFSQQDLNFSEQKRDNNFIVSNLDTQVFKWMKKNKFLRMKFPVWFQPSLWL